ncbi:HdeD family acid-resistance protein [Ruegeria faecimaris]|uniref:HdeD family acid-resistance protein n=1 Tax=Ruegeria faecimaris TaxID=686389 RepID=UPI00232F3269|nr:DUF308 domain-containing protein [Ruegeria faecimaris]
MFENAIDQGKDTMSMGNSDNDLQKYWGWFLGLGIVLAIGGVFAFFAPFLVSLAIEFAVGFVFAVGGFVVLVQVFTTKDGWNARLIYSILGGFNLIAGLLLIFRPLEGLMALTLVLIVAIFVNGLMRIAVGVMARPDQGSGWVISVGCVSVLASGYVLAKYPEVSVMLLGIVARVSLIGEGAGYIRFANGLRNDVSVAV